MKYTISSVWLWWMFHSGSIRSDVSFRPDEQVEVPGGCVTFINVMCGQYRIPDGPGFQSESERKSCGAQET